ncbi:hypothetical protein C4D60_Mb07t13640 [Musa balbisiana]|uniref:Uncharacterized protein n=1 Tax=Musa balbisiana TaxID=52838 RepID=A0A4S8JG94_MUSBA|nr:hypothetical protein C4D60_Mb07t13640 [Musa balbisiana]
MEVTRVARGSLISCDMHDQNKAEDVRTWMYWEEVICEFQWSVQEECKACGAIGKINGVLGRTDEQIFLLREGNPLMKRITSYQLKRMRRSELCFFSNRFFRNSSRALSTSAISSGVPRLGSNSHTCLPMWLLLVRSHGPLPSAILSLHIAGSKGIAGKPYSRFAPRMRRWRDRPDRETNGGEDGLVVWERTRR